MEQLVLPQWWGLDTAFPSRRAFFHYVYPTREVLDGIFEARRRENPNFLVRNTSQVVSSPSCSSSSSSTLCEACATTTAYAGKMSCITYWGPCGPSSRLLYHSARWAELLSGVVLARLMTDETPTEMLSGFNHERVDPALTKAVFASIREVEWEPQLHWMFPVRVKDRMRYLSWVGGQLGLNPIWTMKVLPFLGTLDCEPKPAASALEAPQLLSSSVSAILGLDRRRWIHVPPNVYADRGS